MAKFFRKRDDDNAQSANAYMTTQPVDYTSLPVIESQGPLDRFKLLPLPTRLLLVLVPLLLIGGGIWAATQYFKAPPAVPPPPPIVLALTEANATGPQGIAVNGTVTNATPGLSVTASLLENGAPIAWASPDSASAAVGADGVVALRLTRAPDWNQRLQPDATYSVGLAAAGAEPVSTTLTISSRIAKDFYAAGVPEPTATPAPTTAPAPTVEPTPAGPPSLTTAANATLLVSPTLGSAVLTTLPAGTKLEPALRTNDSQFFLIVQNELVGWLPAAQATIEPQEVARLQPVTPDAGAADAGPLKATVANGGNIRYRPSVQTGTVLGQMIAGQTVTLKEKTANGVWYHIVAPAAEGWVSASLLAIDARTVASVPLAK